MNPVKVDIIMTEGESKVMSNLQRKAGQADKMFTSLVAEMNNALKVDRDQRFNVSEEIPSWL